jgi:hypothetical protein
MKLRIFILLIAFTIYFFGYSQINDLVKWSAEDIETSKKDEYILQAEVFIETGWHLYAQNVPPRGT